MNAAPIINVKLDEQHTHVAGFGGFYWPAQQRPEGLIVDFRLFDMDHQDLRHFPEKLAKVHVPAHLIKAAGESNPPGFVLIVEGGQS